MTMQKLFELSAEELDEIEQRVASASNGPWFSYVQGRDHEACSNCIETGCCNELGSFRSIELVGGTIADQDFIAAARQDLPRLVREVRILRARLRAQDGVANDELSESGVFLERSPPLHARGQA